jgi:oligopeptide/dipeptide ABC transporter ATP-binding protein
MTDRSVIANAPVLEMSHVRVVYRSRHGLVRAVRDASLTVGEGEAVGLVGESGSGKSTLARATLGLLAEQSGVVDGGRVVVAGVDATRFTPRQWQSLRGRPVAIVFQDPLSFLNPVMRVGPQIAESVRQHERDIAVPARVAELLALVKLPAGCERLYAHELSGGMRQRVLLAIALGCRPELLVADEPTTALDVTTQAEILALLRELRDRLGMALLLISHDLAVVSSMCDRVVVMYGGCTVEVGPIAKVFSEPAHPYTVALMRAARAERDDDTGFVTIEGDNPAEHKQTTGCPFEPRCVRAIARCADQMPVLAPVRNGHLVRCWCAS